MTTPVPYFQTDDVTLYCGDCLKILPNLGKVDAVVTDPPYAMTDLEWDKAFDIGRWWDLVEAVTGKGKATVLTASQPFTSLMVMSRRSRFRTEWIWKKNAGSNFATTKWHPMKEHESVLVFGDGPTTYNPIKQPRSSPLKAGYTNTSNTGKRKAYSGVMVNKGFTVTDGEMRVPSSVQQWNRERGHHPNQKPVEMFGYFIRTYSNEGETVLDPFMGSGTTGVACVKTGRKFIGIELDPAYCEIAKQRIEKALSERGQAVA